MTIPPRGGSPSTEPPKQSQLGQFGQQTQRILVVDDSASIRLLYCTILEAAGYVVQTAASGQDALALALESPPDAVLVDLIMPGMDGLEMLRALRRAEQAMESLSSASVPALLLTALDEPDITAEERAALGVFMLLDKAHLKSPDLVRAVQLALAPRS